MLSKERIYGAAQSRGTEMIQMNFLPYAPQTPGASSTRAKVPPNCAFERDAFGPSLSASRTLGRR
jgi:hypothetical protein